MNKSEYYDLLLKDFEAASKTVESIKSTIHDDNGRWILDGTDFDPVFRQFRPGAIDGGSLVSPGLVGDDAVRQWLDLLRDRIGGKYYQALNGDAVRTEMRMIPRSSIVEPRKEDVLEWRQIRAHRSAVLDDSVGTGDVSIVTVEAQDDRFVVVHHHDLLEWLKPSPDGLVRCDLQTVVPRGGGILRFYFEASILLATALRNDARAQERAIEAAPVTRDTAAWTNEMIDRAYASLGPTLERYRRIAGYTVAGLATSIGLNQRTVADHLTKGMIPSPKTLSDYASAFSTALNRKVTTEDLLREALSTTAEHRTI